jgi:hypothetical protein
VTSAILSVKVTPVSATGGTRRAIGGFLRYIQHRDHHFDREQVRDVDGLVRYVAFRAAASPQGRLFDADGTVGTAERHALTKHIARSVMGVKPRWVPGRDGQLRDQNLAVYRFVLSPADSRGLDLRGLTRTTMAELRDRLGERAMPPWIAAEHRNTEHPHVHIVMAARRELVPGRYRQVRLTRVRLAAMKEAMWADIERQRGERVKVRGRTNEVLGRVRQTGRGDRAVEPSLRRQREPMDLLRPTGPRTAPRDHASAWRPTRRRRGRGFGRSLSRQLGALAAYYRREAVKQAEERLHREREERDDQQREVTR